MFFLFNVFYNKKIIYFLLLKYLITKTLLLGLGTYSSKKYTNMHANMLLKS
jgi:hypothetical protein